MIMKKISFFIILLLAFFAVSQVTAQEDAAYSATPDNMWEFGIGLGHATTIGDFDYKPGYGGSIHLQKALDYVFALRVSAFYKAFNGKVDSPRSSSIQTGIKDFASTTMGGAVHGVVSVNNLIWKSAKKKINLYALAGAGVHKLAVKGTADAGDNTDLLKNGSTEIPSLASFADGGVGIAFKISPKFNIALEHIATVPFGKQSDFLDGFNNFGSTVTTYRDILHFTALKFNFNLGNSDAKAQPLYWLNPLDMVMNDISELKARPKLDLTDTDKDGIIDMLDQEVNSPEGAPVDTRGKVLDSDNDGIPDYKDKEPYSPPGMTVSQDGIAQKPDYTTKNQVSGMIADALKNYEMSSSTPSLVDWFLPMIHFNLDRYTIRHADYGNLANIAHVMKANPSIRIVVTGYTDRSSTDSYNRMLSYNRAKAAIEHLVNVLGVSRERLILNYGGEDKNLVPTNGANFMNRRVEFKVATDETEMGRPEGRNAGKGTFSGSKNAGY